MYNRLTWRRRQTAPQTGVILLALFLLHSVPLAGEAAVVTEFQRNAPAWKSAEPRYVGYAFEQWWPSPGNSFAGCVVDQGDPTAPRTLNLIGGTCTVTSRDSNGANVCPFSDGTSVERTSDVLLGPGGEALFQFSPPISAFYTNYGSLAAGSTCTMRLYSGGVLVDSITSAVSSDSGAAAGHGFSSPVPIDEIRITSTENGNVLIGAFRGTLGSKDVLGDVCAVPCPTPMDFACVFEGDQITISLPGLSGSKDEVIVVPKGRTIYALLVSGYAQNADLNLLHFFNFAHYVLKQGGYVHYAWWNNLLAPYMERPLHDSGSFPGNLATEFGGFAPAPGPNGYFAEKARPEEDTQFQSDAHRFLAAIKDAEPNALLVVVGHSMGGGAVARLGDEMETPIDILAPIDPVGNRSVPVGRINQNDYNWTRWRAVHRDFLGFKDQDCRRLLSFCTLPLDCSPLGNWHDAPPGLSGGWLLHAPQCGPLVHNPTARHFTKIRNLYHKWQTESPFPLVDYDTNRYFIFTPPPGGKSIQQAVNTCDSGNDPIDPSINCTGSDGHGEIVGFRRIPPNMILDGVAATNWTSSSILRKQYLQEWETQGDAWDHKPTKPQLCMVSNGLVSLLQSIITYDDAALVAEMERSAQEWKEAVSGRWEAYAFDEFWPSPSPSSFTGCAISGQPDPTAPRALQLTGGQVTVSAIDSSGNPVCPMSDATSAARSTDLVIPAGGRAVMVFDPPIGAFYTTYGSLEEGSNARMDLHAGDQLVDFVISSASPASANSVQAIGHGFVSPKLIDRIEFTATETGGSVLIGGFRGVLSAADSLGQVCIPDYSPSCSSRIDFDFAVVFGPGPIVNQTQPGGLFYYTLQAGIQGAHDGDLIVAAPGIYREFINFTGKAINLRGAEAWSAGGGSMIDVTGLSGAGSAVTFASGEGPDSVLQGFTVTGGIGTFVSGERRGGGMYLNHAAPTLIDCRCEGNSATRGGGVFSIDGDPEFVNCIFTGNQAERGGGLAGVAGAPTLTNCLFAGNEASSGGGGLLVHSRARLGFVNCTVVANSVVDGFGGGVFVGGDSTLIAANSIFWNNAAASSGQPGDRQVHIEDTGFALVTFSDIEDDDPGAGEIPLGGAANRNIDLEPRFLDAANGNYRLAQTSPCVDAGDDASVPSDRVDLDGDGDVSEPIPFDLGGAPRIFDADVGSTAFVDLGAYEFFGSRADFDGDADVDLDDYARFQACATGPAIPYGPALPAGCTLARYTSGRISADFDGDTDVDQEDFARFQRCFSGANKPADPNCAN